MKTLHKYLLVCLLGALPLSSMAQELKIGVVNPNRLLDDAPQSKIALQRLEKEFAARDSKFLTEQKSIKKLEDKLATDAAIMSEAERRKLERSIVARKRELRRGFDELREDRTFRSNEERSKLLKFVNDAIVKIGKDEKYDLILYDGIAFANPAIDVTKKVLIRLQNAAKANKK